MADLDLSDAGIEALAREVVQEYFAPDPRNVDLLALVLAALRRVAEAATQAEWERCARVAERYNGPVASSDGRRAMGPGELIAAAIREAAKEGK